jgi:hypothetical protein
MASTWGVTHDEDDAYYLKHEQETEDAMHGDVGVSVVVVVTE